MFSEDGSVSESDVIQPCIDLCVINCRYREGSILKGSIWFMRSDSCSGSVPGSKSFISPKDKIKTACFQAKSISVKPLFKKTEGW